MLRPEGEEAVNTLSAEVGLFRRHPMALAPPRPPALVIKQALLYGARFQDPYLPSAGENDNQEVVLMLRHIQIGHLLRDAHIGERTGRKEIQPIPLGAARLIQLVCPTCSAGRFCHGLPLTSCALCRVHMRKHKMHHLHNAGRISFNQVFDEVRIEICRLSTCVQQLVLPLRVEA